MGDQCSGKFSWPGWSMILSRVGGWISRPSTVDSGEARCTSILNGWYKVTLPSEFAIWLLQIVLWRVWRTRGVAGGCRSRVHPSLLIDSCLNSQMMFHRSKLRNQVARGLRLLVCLNRCQRHAQGVPRCCTWDRDVACHPEVCSTRA